MMIVTYSESISCDGETGTFPRAEVKTLQWPLPQAECSGWTTQKSMKS